MSLRHAILGLLERQPSTGYELARKFDLSLATAWHASHSQIYPELSRLEAAGLVEVVARGARQSKTYALTEGGRDELRRWLIKEAPDRSQRNEGALRLFLGQLLDPGDRRAVFERDLAYVEEQTEQLHDLQSRLEPGEPFAAQVDLGLRINAVLAAWLSEQIGHPRPAPPPPHTEAGPR